MTIPVKYLNGRLLVVGASLGGVPVKAVIDTGGQATLGNEALRAALEERKRRGYTVRPDQVTGATLDVQPGSTLEAPALALGAVLVQNPSLTFADFAIFEYWKMTDEPALLIGMDVLGLLDTLIIDYRRKELQVKLPPQLIQAAFRVPMSVTRASALWRRFVTMRSCNSLMVSLPVVQKAPGTIACTMHTIPPQIMRSPKPMAATKCCP